ncbi:hypothetical protein MMC10_006454 [Thelotrema lepadinum]|nr:hypothetical protein [Thelotrema lepadinum]
MASRDFSLRLGDWSIDPGFSLLFRHDIDIRHPSRQQIDIIRGFFPGSFVHTIAFESNAMILVCKTLPPTPRPIFFANIPILFTTDPHDRGFAADLRFHFPSPAFMPEVKFPPFTLEIPTDILNGFARHCVLNEVPLHSLGASIGGIVIATITKACDPKKLPKKIGDRPLIFKFRDGCTVRDRRFIPTPRSPDFTSYTPDFRPGSVIETPAYGKLVELNSPDDGHLTGYVSRTEYEMVPEAGEDGKEKTEWSWRLLFWIPLFRDGGVLVPSPSPIPCGTPITMVDENHQGRLVALYRSHDEEAKMSVAVAAPEDFDISPPRADVCDEKPCLKRSGLSAKL